MRHGGSVMAPDAELALHYAREMYGRRQESVRLWVVRRADILDLDDPDLLQPPLDRSFKKPGGYVMRDKLAAAREAAGQAKPKARSTVSDRMAAAPAPTELALAELLLLDGRRRVRHRLLRLRVDRDRAAPRGGRRDELARPGRARPRRGAVRPARRRSTGDRPGRARLRPRARRLPPLPAARPRPRRLGDDDRPALLYDTADAVRLEALAGALVDAARRARREARPRGALPPDARRGLARAPRARRDGEPRDRACSPRSRRSAPMPRPCSRRSPASRRSSRPGSSTRRWPSSRRAGARRIAPILAASRPARCRRPPRDPTRGRLDHGEPFRWLWGEFTLGPPRRPRSDLVSEAGTQIGIARLRAGVTAPTAADPTTPTAAAPSTSTPSARAGRGDGPGAPDAVGRRPRDRPPASRSAPRDGAIRVEILPTFVGCPRSSSSRRRSRSGSPRSAGRSRSTATFEVPWTSERISPAGRRALLAAGIAPPTGRDRERGAATLIDLEPRVPCPHCGSRRTTLENVFGPTQCRSIRYCPDCRQPFEAIKPV